MNSEIIKIVLRFALYAILQIIFFRNASFFGTALAYPYVGFILLLPINITNVTSLFIGFATGLTMDIFYDTLGIHAAACTFMAFMRIFFYQWMSPLNSIEMNASPSVYNIGTQWFTYYALAMIFCHHIVMFAIELGKWNNIGNAFVWAISSTLFTFAIIISVQYIFGAPSRRG